MKGVGFAFLGFAVFSGHDALIKSLRDYSVFQILFFATLFSYVPFSIALSLGADAVHLRPKQPKMVLLRSGFMAATGILAFTAFGQLPMTEVYAILFTSPMMISVLAIIFLNEKIHAFRWFAIVLGLVGVLVVLRPGVSGLNGGHLAALGAAFCSSFASILARKMGGDEHVAAATLWPMVLGLAVNGGLMIGAYQPMLMEVMFKMFAIGVLGLIGTTLVLQGYRNAPAQFVAPIQYSQMLWAIMYGTLFFYEKPDRFVLLGCSLIVLSGLLIVWRETRISKQKPALSTRNFRAVAGPPMRSSELDK